MPQLAKQNISHNGKNKRGEGATLSNARLCCSCGAGVAHGFNLEVWVSVDICYDSGEGLWEAESVECCDESLWVHFVESFFPVQE